MAARDGSELERGEIDVAGVRRSYWLARAPRQRGQPAPPLIIALHGSGMDGRGMARLTGLANRGPAAGVTTVFPDGWQQAWHPGRPPDGEPDLDDALFLLELATQLEGLGAASSWPILLAGTADRTTPYEGGRLIRRGFTGLRQKRRAVKHGELQDEDIVLSAEALMVDWAAANGITAGPAIEELDTPPGELPVTRKSWTRPGAHPVTLYRINGGGHGWPGDPKKLDATALLLDMAGRESPPADLPWSPAPPPAAPALRTDAAWGGVPGAGRR